LSAFNLMTDPEGTDIRCQTRSPMKTALFIAYNFPPCGGPSVQRSLKFVKYLPALGWQSVVVAADSRAYPLKDLSLEKDIPPNTPLFRAKSWDVNAWRAAFVKLRLGKLHSLINTLLALPDTAVFWTRCARPAVRRVIKLHRPAVVYTTSGPYSAHLLGLWIRRTFGLPWVADFRDPWSQNRIIRYPPGYRAVNRHLEQRVLQAADHVVTVSEPIAQDLRHLMGSASTPIRVIPNGYDPDDVTPTEAVTMSKFVLAHTGKFTRLRQPDVLIKAVTALVDTGQIPVNQIELVFAGSNLDAFVPTRAPFTKLGYLPHNELAALWQYSTMLLLVQDPAPENRGAYSAKLFEYLAANRPILAITSPASVSAELIRDAQSGVIVGHDLDQVKSVLLDCYQRWRIGRLYHRPNWEVIQRFSRPALTAELAEIFRQLAGE
jgi:glycosyltransferase involved in cell wall biosynthesis